MPETFPFDYKKNKNINLKTYNGKAKNDWRIAILCCTCTHCYDACHLEKENGYEYCNNVQSRLCWFMSFERNYENENHMVFRKQQMEHCKNVSESEISRNVPWNEMANRNVQN
jgi:hypothetical protein